MKRKWHHPEEAPDATRDYWRSAGELEDSEEFRGWLEREFPQGAAEMEVDGDSRRQFLKLMGASTALAGFGVSCSRPLRHLVPYNEHVEWVIPGRALYYSSAKPRLGGVGCDPLVVTTHEGRPTKVDGNRLHPRQSGGSNAFIQASILDLYDQDRSKGFLSGDKPSTRKEFSEKFLEPFQERKDGGKVALLVEKNTSPTRQRLLDELEKRYPGLSVHTHNAVGADGAVAAAEKLHGPGVVPVPRLDKAEKILSLDCDFLGYEPVGEDSSAEFFRGRNPERAGKAEKSGEGPGMTRLYAAEAAFSLTGGMADHRYRLAPSQMLPLALLVGAELAEALGDADLKKVVEPALAKVNQIVYRRDWIVECAADLAASAGASLVLAGGRQNEELHLVVAAINKALGAYGPVIRLVDHGPAAAKGKDLADLVASIEAGEVDTVIACGEFDPVFDAPADLAVEEAFGKLESLVHVGTRRNLTAKAATWHVPGTHYLEAWGDCWSHTGVYSVQQPMIDPLWGGVSELDFYLSLLGEGAAFAEVTEIVEADAETEAEAGAGNEGAEEGKGKAAADEAGAAESADAPEAEAKAAGADKVADADKAAEPADAGRTPLDAVKETFAAVGGQDWVAALRDGFAKGPKLKQVGSKSVDLTGAAKALARVEIADLPHPEALEVVLATSGACYDGRFANNGWLQEAPDPITKLTWDNAALISQRTAEQLGLEDGDLVALKVEGRRVKAPVLVSPGHADYCVTLPVGYYGKAGEGVVAKGAGHNAYPLAAAAASYLVSGVTLNLLGEKYPLALTAEHYSMEGRAIAREGTLEMYREHADFAQHQGMDHHIPENISLYKGPEYRTDGDPNDTAVNQRNQSPALHGHEYRIDPHHQWAMTVDLNSCTGCNACVIACQAENNIPIVGKDQVLAGREMHWIRMDRYFSSPRDHKPVSAEGIRYNEEKHGEPGKRRVDDDRIEMLPQPVACQQCESAPCETVCPVNATTHTGDGLNAMTYNRCIGTRYCANNCPYKARRFNYYDYNKRPIHEIEVGGIKAEGIKFGPLAPASGNATTSQQLQKNPNVTVRMRGVIEKCTYCVQRISAAKIAAKAAARDSDDIQVPANSFTVACQDACGSGAIQFGNLNNPKDRINSQAGKKNPRNYDLLKYVGTLPRTSYLARIKNPNPKMPGADIVGTVTSKMH